LDYTQPDVGGQSLDANGQLFFDIFQLDGLSATVMTVKPLLQAVLRSEAP